MILSRYLVITPILEGTRPILSLYIRHFNICIITYSVKFYFFRKKLCPDKLIIATFTSKYIKLLLYVHKDYKYIVDSKANGEITTSRVSMVVVV